MIKDNSDKRGILKIIPTSTSNGLEKLYGTIIKKIKLGK